MKHGEGSIPWHGASWDMGFDQFYWGWNWMSHWSLGDVAAQDGLTGKSCLCAFEPTSIV
jgi:hypothetical protein